MDLRCSFGARQFWSRLIRDSRLRPDDGPPVQIMVPAGYAGYRRSRPSFRGWQRAVAGAKRSSWVRSRRGGRSSACVGARTPGPTLVTASSTPASSQLHEPAGRPARSIGPAADAHTTLGFPAASATGNAPPGCGDRSSPAACAATPNSSRHSTASTSTSPNSTPACSPTPPASRPARAPHVPVPRGG